jgi:hypothetical protein
MYNAMAVNKCETFDCLAQDILIQSLRVPLRI